MWLIKFKNVAHIVRFYRQDTRDPGAAGASHQDHAQDTHASRAIQRPDGQRQRATPAPHATCRFSPRLLLRLARRASRVPHVLPTPPSRARLLLVKRNARGQPPPLTARVASHPRRLVPRGRPLAAALLAARSPPARAARRNPARQQLAPLASEPLERRRLGMGRDPALVPVRRLGGERRRDQRGQLGQSHLRARHYRVWRVAAGCGPLCLRRRLAAADDVVHRRGVLPCTAELAARLVGLRRRLGHNVEGEARQRPLGRSYGGRRRGLVVDVSQDRSVATRLAARSAEERMLRHPDGEGGADEDKRLSTAAAVRRKRCYRAQAEGGAREGGQAPLRTRASGAPCGTGKRSATRTPRRRAAPAAAPARRRQGRLAAHPAPFASPWGRIGPPPYTSLGRRRPPAGAAGEPPRVPEARGRVLHRDPSHPPPTRLWRSRGLTAPGRCSRRPRIGSRARRT